VVLLVKIDCIVLRERERQQTTERWPAKNAARENQQHTRDVSHLASVFFVGIFQVQNRYFLATIHTNFVRLVQFIAFRRG